MRRFRSSNRSASPFSVAHKIRTAAGDFIPIRRAASNRRAGPSARCQRWRAPAVADGHAKTSNAAFAFCAQHNCRMALGPPSRAKRPGVGLLRWPAVCYVQIPGATPAVTSGLLWLCNDWPRDSSPWRRFLARFSSQQEIFPINNSYRGWGWTPGDQFVGGTDFVRIARAGAGE